MRFLNFLFMTLLLLGLVAGVGTARAQIGLASDGSHIRPQLLAETQTPRPGGTVTIALLMRPDAGWHGYWKNPGDAGLGVDARWSVPEGASVGPLRYPTPGRLLVAGLMNHVYEGPYALLADVRIPPRVRPGDAFRIGLEARWLACTDTVCVPEQAKLSLPLTIGAGRIEGDDRRRFDAWRAAMPRPLGVPARYQRQGNTIRIAVPYPATGAVGDPWFYAETRDAIIYAAPQRTVRAADVLVVETRAAMEGPEGAIEGVLAVGPDVALSLSATPGPVPAGGEPVGANASGGPGISLFVLTLAGALLGGLLLNIMPCVFPILSLKAIALARAGGDEREARAEAVAYTAGILLTCLALGGLILALRAAGHSVGWAFQLQDDRVIALLLVLVTAITLNLAGLFDLPALDAGRQASGARGAFLTGILAAFVATPCTGPFMAAAVGAAFVMPWPLALTVFAGLGLGLAAPFLALAFIPALRKRLPRPGPWMERLRHVMAVPMGLTALALVWLLWRQAGTMGAGLAGLLILATLLLCMLVGRRQKAGHAAGLRGAAAALGLALAALVAPALLPAAAERGRVAGEVPFSPSALAELRAAGRPVFLYFTADWCVTCKVNEAAAIADSDVRRRFAERDVAVMVGDWTKGDPDITRFLEAHGRSGVPLYLYYAPGAATGQILPQVLTPGTLTALVGG